MYEDINISDRVSELRRRRGLTQEDLADRTGLSVPTIKKIEQGRGGARMETYHTIARALGVVTLAFVTPQAPKPRVDTNQDAALAGMRSAINPPLNLNGEPMASPHLDEPDLRMLKQAVAAISAAYVSDRYDTVAQLTPAVVHSAHFHVRELDGQDEHTARQLRAGALSVAGRYLIQVREHDLALFALRDSLRDALAVGDQAAAAAAISFQAWALMRQARFSEVESLCVAAADQVEPKISTARTEELGAWGFLLLRAAGAAARNNRPDSAEEYLSVATAAAAATGRETKVKGSWSWGPVTVGVQGPQLALLAGRPDKALELSDRLPQEAGRTMDNDWHRHRIDVAKASVMTGDADRATEILTKIKQASPEWMEHQQSARDVAEDILGSRKRMPTEEQRALADFLHVQV